MSPDDHAGQAEVRRSTTIPIASGEREFTRFDFQDLLERRALDIAQPDVARAGGMTEIRRIAALTSAHGVRLAPHAWGSGVLFAASIHVAMAAAQLPHPRGDAGLHADDVGALQRAVRHPLRRHGARAGAAGPRLHAARRTRWSDSGTSTGRSSSSRAKSNLIESRGIPRAREYDSHCLLDKRARAPIRFQAVSGR